MTRKIYRQGDIIFQPIARLPRGAAKTGRYELIITGETGHTHTLAGVTIYQESIRAGSVALAVVPEGGAMVVHDSPQPHDPVSLPAGIFRVFREREYDPERVIRDTVD